jgi:type I restriction enzyme, S subunit
VLKAAVEGHLVPTEAHLARTEKRAYESAEVLLARILKERRRRWEEAQLAKLKAAGKTPKDDKWKAKYKEPTAPDTSALPEVPVGWCWATVEGIATKVVDGVHKKPDYVSSGVPFVTVKNLTAGPGIDFENLKYITIEDHRKFIARANPERGDLLVSKDGTLGVIRAVRTDSIFSIFVSVAMIKPVLISMSDYLELALSSPSVQAQMVPKGSGLQHIHLEDLRRDCVPIPPAAEQIRILEAAQRRMSVVEWVEAAIAHDLAKLSRLRQAVLKRAFEGKLVDQDPTDEPAEKLLARIRAECVAVDQSKNHSRKARGAA